MSNAATQTTPDPEGVILQQRLREWRRRPHNDRDAALVALALTVRDLTKPGDLNRKLADAVLREERLLPLL